MKGTCFRVTSVLMLFVMIFQFKRLKGILSIITIVSMLLSFPIIANADDNETSNSTQSMDEIDLLLVSHRYLSSADSKNSLWDDNNQVDQIIPLYDIDGNIISYYITFTHAGYAIVNNNLDNPVAIEFGDNYNEMIQDLENDKDQTTEDAKIYYLNPVNIMDQKGFNDFIKEGNKSKIK